MGWAERIAIEIMRRAAKRYLRLQPYSGEFPPLPDQTPRLLYIHIPFCLTLCPYCSFHKFRFDEPSARVYFELLRHEMEKVHTLGYRFDSLYFGGGTTTILPDELVRTIDRAKELFDIREVSCESDPIHVSDLLTPELSGKIDRLSIGIQSFNDAHLQKIGRYKKFGSGEEQYRAVEKALKHFKIVNVDMIYNYPDQSDEELHRELDTLIRLGSGQVTFYPLMYAPHIREKLSRMWGELDDEKESRMYRIIDQRMSECYTRRSGWAWSREKEGIIDEYVIERSEYVGIGSGAFSFIGDTLYANTFSLPEYAERLRSDRFPLTHAVRFPSRAIAQYRMMVEGFGLSSMDHALLPEKILLRWSGMIVGEKLTPRGVHLFSLMMREFYNGMDYVRETMRHHLKDEDGIIR